MPLDVSLWHARGLRSVGAFRRSAERRNLDDSFAEHGGDLAQLRHQVGELGGGELLRAVGETGHPSLADYLADEKNALIDLMDLCDARDVAYTFVGVGPASGVQCRPAM